jgi:hypothetical protein
MPLLWRDETGQHHTTPPPNTVLVPVEVEDVDEFDFRQQDDVNLALSVLGVFGIIIAALVGIIYAVVMR